MQTADVLESDFSKYFRWLEPLSRLEFLLGNLDSLRVFLNSPYYLYMLGERGANESGQFQGLLKPLDYVCPECNILSCRMDCLTSTWNSLCLNKLPSNMNSFIPKETATQHWPYPL